MTTVLNTTMRRAASIFLAWILFFSISAGLGYSGLNRYDPREQLPDAAVYAELATSGPAATTDQFRFRILVPLLAHGVHRFVVGRTGSWDPLMFSFLLVNAAFVATTACLVLTIGTVQLASSSVALFGSALYLLNFAVANLHLAGLVDAAEACLIMAVAASMFHGRWPMLPLWGALGALAKESFVPFSTVMALAWWFVSKDREKRELLWIVTMIAVEVVTMIVLQSSISGRLIWPWAFAAGLNSSTGFGTNLLHSFVDRNSWYVLAWLVPLGLVQIKRFPRPWVAAAGAGALTAVVLNAYHSTVGGGGGGIGRYVFDVAGPLLSLSAAAFLTGFLDRTSSPPR